MKIKARGEITPDDNHAARRWWRLSFVAANHENDFGHEYGCNAFGSWRNVIDANAKLFDLGIRDFYIDQMLGDILFENHSDAVLAKLAFPNG